MITCLKLIRNIGKFISASSSILFNRLTVIYGENGSGKTTIAEIFRSCATNDPNLIIERKRHGNESDPHVIVHYLDQSSKAIFKDGEWSRSLENIAVFDDVFTDQNVYSGLTVDTGHRQNLHQIIIGAGGVQLQSELEKHIAQIESHNRVLRELTARIPTNARGSLSMEDFCNLPAKKTVDQEIQTAERSLQAAREQDPLQKQPLFNTLDLPSFDLKTIEQVLQTGIQELSTYALTLVQNHLNSIGKGAEEWISAGMRHQTERSQDEANKCSFCAQDLANSPIFKHYPIFFSTSYKELQQKILCTESSLNKTHPSDLGISLERALRILDERKQFWKQFIDIPVFQVDTTTIIRDMLAVHQSLADLLIQKKARPLERIIVSDTVRTAVLRHEENRASIEVANIQLRKANESIVAIQQQAMTANPVVLETTLGQLRAIKNRHMPDIAANCQAYLDEKKAKSNTERIRDEARAKLENYRTEIFPKHEAAINRHLQRFNAGFKIGNVSPINSRSSPSCNYDVIILDTSIPVSTKPQPGERSFKNTLSAGDRTTLALAFFFSLIELHPKPSSLIVVIDDPVSSLDEHRSLVSIQEIRRLSQEVAQVVLLSHSKPFLCQLWDRIDEKQAQALHIIRDGNASLIQKWDIACDLITEHDRRHHALREYLNNGSPRKAREVAQSIRPLLEHFLRVVYPAHFPPGQLLGSFLDRCRQQGNDQQQILSRDAIKELGNIVEYANLFHHDTNSSYKTQEINDTELSGYVQRVLTFATK